MDKKINVVLLLTASLASSGSFAMKTRYYSALVDASTWQVQTSPLQCKLSHVIPEYGMIRFEQDAGVDEKAMLEIDYQRAIDFEQGELAFQSPPWKNQMVDHPGWRFQMTNKEPVIFSARQARRILNELDQGLMTVITHRDNHYRIEALQAEVTTVQFPSAYNTYINCQKNLVPYTFEGIQKSNIYFTTASSRLDEPSKELLNYIVEYAKDPDVYRIELSGYTDSIGSFRANHKLASRRVEKVRDFLLSNGIPEKIMRFKVFGEQRPLASNKTTKGRDQNRRVFVRILR